MKYRLYYGFIICFWFMSWAGGYAEPQTISLNPQQQQQADELFTLVKCPVCTGQNLAESHVDIAIDLKELIKQKLSQGKTSAQIQQELVEIYGDDILFAPPKNHRTFLLWFGPYVILAIIAGLMWRKSGSSKQD